MKNCNTCVHVMENGSCSIHRTIPGGCDDYMVDIPMPDLIELQEYRKLGTVEEVRKEVERMNPQKIKHIHNEYKKHKWIRTEDGKIDNFAMDVGYHNGPHCERCGYSFCIHCDPNGYNKVKCETDDYLCPTCGSHVFRKATFCNKCGQKLRQSDEK